MSLLSATQIPKPSDEQAFERACVPLWCGLLNDPNVQKNARRGQGQDGVDLYGMRDRDPDQFVGIQCKLKGDGKQLSEKEVRDEVEKAVKFKPPLREYFIVTTAPDDGEMHELARVITAELKAKGSEMLVYIWGWNTLEDRISADHKARKAFDPSFGPFSARILDNTEALLAGQSETQSSVAQIEAKLTQLTATFAVPPGDATIGVNVFEAHLDAEIDTFRELANAGKPRTALPLLEGLFGRVGSNGSGRILFRIKANIGFCYLALGEPERAADLLAEAHEHAPNEPKAIANKAFSLLLRHEWRELLQWGQDALAVDPTNDWLASYLVQAARFDPAISEPLDLLPDPVKTSVAVAVARVDFLRHRGLTPDWWQAARSTFAAHPDDRYARKFAAEADLDEVMRDAKFRNTRLLAPAQRARVANAAEVLRRLWDETRAGERIIRPEDAALCCNLIMAYHALDEAPQACDVARKALELAPDDVELLNRAAIVAIDGQDNALAETILPRLPSGPDAVVLAFRLYAARNDWKELAHLCQTQSEHIPEIERHLIVTTGCLAEIKLARPNDIEGEVAKIAKDAIGDPRASIAVAEFARAEGLANLSEAAFKSALERIDPSTHIAARMMVALHAERRGEARVVADLLNGYVAEDHDSDGLRALTRAFVNDSPIRRRAIRFFEKLSAPLKDLSFYQHAEGLLHHNRGELKQAEKCLRKAIETSPDVINYLTLFSTLRRADREADIKPILAGLDPASLKGTPGQKMFLAQQLFAADMPTIAFSFAYDVLQGSKNDAEAALRYFGLMMLDPNGRHIPRAREVAVDAWVRLEGAHGDEYTFRVEAGPDRPADGVLSPTHAIAAGAMGLKVGGTFTVEALLGTGAVWRIAEIKHKYLHALHDVMASFQTRFPDAKGFYTVRAQDKDIQPALEEIRRFSESNRKLADLYFLQHLPMAMVSARLSRDSVGFADYIRSLDQEIVTSIGTMPERKAERMIIDQHRATGAVLDAYAAWTAATMDILDILRAVFGKLVLSQSCMDELRSLVDRQEFGSGGRSMTIAWHDGRFVRQEFTAEDNRARNAFIKSQIAKIEDACEVVASSAPDEPSELASMLTDTFGADVLDSADVAASGYVLLSEDLYYRQIATEAAGANATGVCLQSALSFARQKKLIPEERYAAAVVGLASRRHGHVWLEAETLFQAWQRDRTDGLLEFTALAEFIGTRNAEMQSHLTVVIAFLNGIWATRDASPGRIMKATGVLLERLIRFRQRDWASSLAIVADGSVRGLREYIEQWMRGHFLNPEEVRREEARLAAVRARIHILRVSQWSHARL